LTKIREKGKIIAYMPKVFDWIRSHKLISVIIGIGIFLFLRANVIVPLVGSTVSRSTGSAGVMSIDATKGSLPYTGGGPVYYSEAAPTQGITDRKVVLDSNFSLLVKNVTESVENVKAKTTQLSGYMVNMTIDRSDYGDTASIQVRVPTEKLDEFSKYLRDLAVKVVSENIDGTDITDQYVDIERRLGDLEKQRVRVEKILDSAITVTDMMEVQRQLFMIQDQIDAYKGQLIYMDGTTKTSKLSIYISTDELSLPYSPSRPWRPEVIFKQAVRSFVEDIQDIGSLLIWLIVYSPLIIIAIVVFKLIRKKLKKSVQ
jgi:hypothetical protein